MKKWVATILALVLALGLCSVSWAAESWTGSGTEADPYVITTEAGLKKLATDVNSGTVYSGKYFKLGASVAVTDWTPIGQKNNDVNKFAGTFDGSGQTVTINGISGRLDNAFGGYAALFGAIKGATIKNVTVTGTINGADVAGVVGQMNGGTVENCVNKATVVGTKKAAGIVVYTKNSGSAVIKDCVNYGEIKSSGDRAGGIVNLVQIATEVLNCKNYGAVTSGATGTYAAGGIVGWVGLEQSGAQFKIDGCENTAAVSGKGAAGGILGGASGSVGTVSGCVNSGTVTLSGTAGTSNEHANIGGVVGQGHTDMEGLTATENTNTGALAGSYTRRTIAEDVTLADQSYSQMVICKGAKVEITAGKIENYLTNYGTLAIVKGAQIGESGEGGVNAQIQNYGTVTLNCVMKAGSIHSQQGAATVFNGGEYHFTCAEEMRNGLQFVAGKFIDLRSGSGNVQWDDNTFRSYVAEGATVAYDATAHTWTVSMSVAGVALNKSTMELQVGKTETLTATVTPENASEPGVTWTSSDATVATVNENGVVSAVAKGTATITATAGGKSAACTVTVKAASGGYYYYPGSTTTTDTAKASPKTFDAGIGVYAVTAVLSLSGMAWTAKKRH